jgi:hypothetical protein
MISFTMLDAMLTIIIKLKVNLIERKRPKIILLPLPYIIRTNRRLKEIFRMWLIHMRIRVRITILFIRD